MKPIKQKKCASCRDLFAPSNSLQKVCSMACVLDFVQGQTKKDVSKREKEFKKETAQKKRDFLAGDLRFQKSKAQKAFNEFIRLRDANLPCVSCDKPKDWHGQWHAGHYKTVGARPDLRFNEDNCHKQCSVCNNHLSGNLAMYAITLEQRIGKKRMSALDNVAKPEKFTAEYYAIIHKIYTEKVKELKNASQTM